MKISNRELFATWQFIDEANSKRSLSLWVVVDSVAAVKQFGFENKVINVFSTVEGPMLEKPRGQNMARDCSNWHKNTVT